MVSAEDGDDIIPRLVFLMPVANDAVVAAEDDVGETIADMEPSSVENENVSLVSSTMVVPLSRFSMLNFFVGAFVSVVVVVVARFGRVD